MGSPSEEDPSEMTYGTPESTPVALAVGVDVIARERVIRAYERFGERFLHRVFTDREVAEAGGRIERLVSRFAAKEAASKALGTGIGQIAWRELEIQRMPGGNPTLRLSGRAAERASALGLTAFDVSMSDTRTHVFAIVVGVGVTR